MRYSKWKHNNDGSLDKSMRVLIGVWNREKMDICSKQRVAINFCVWLGKDISEIRALLQEVYSEECFAKQMIQHWHKSFRDGCYETSGLPRTGRPPSSIMEVNKRSYRSGPNGGRMHFEWRTLFWKTASNGFWKHCWITCLNNFFFAPKFFLFYFFVGVCQHALTKLAVSHWLFQVTSWFYALSTRIELQNTIVYGSSLIECAASAYERRV